MENVYINKIMIYGSSGRLLDVVRIAEFSNIKLMEELRRMLAKDYGVSVNKVFAEYIHV
jgi:hypothetical protein